jgi:hypothetical protein
MERVYDSSRGTFACMDGFWGALSTLLEHGNCIALIIPDGADESDPNQVNV